MAQTSGENAAQLQVRGFLIAGHCGRAWERVKHGSDRSRAYLNTVPAVDAHDGLSRGLPDALSLDRLERMQSCGC